MTGPYALLWPGTDRWPGPEMDLLEILPGGAGYATLHWRGENGTSDGANQYSSIGMPGIDATARNTYQYLWTPTELAVYVNGTKIDGFTQNVPKDATEGGENAAPGIGMQTWWSADQQVPCSGVCRENSITLYGFSYESLQ